MNQVFILGDIHGSFEPIENLIKSLTLRGYEIDPTDTIILLGDVGANFFLNHRDEYFKQKLNSFGCNIFAIRGNHEQRPSIIAEKHVDDWHVDIYFDGLVWIENDYPNIKYANDFSHVYNINNHRTLVIPGAYSVDKYYRLKNHWTWFENEQLTEGEMEVGKMICNDFDNKFDLVLSHTCPKSFMPTDLFLPAVDQSTVDNTMENYLEEIERQIDYKLWCFGHYHQLRVYPEVDGRQMLMLFNKEALNLDKYFQTKDIYRSILTPYNFNERVTHYAEE